RLKHSAVAFSALISTSVAAFAADPVVIATQPADYMASDKSAAAFTVKIEGSNAVSFQWYRNGAPISGATNAKLSLPSVTFADSGAKFYAMIVGQPNGAPTSTKSSEATLKVVTPAEAITHRWSFASNANDSVGTANGTLEGTATIADG